MTWKPAPRSGAAAGSPPVLLALEREIYTPSCMLLGAGAVVALRKTQVGGENEKSSLCRRETPLLMLGCCISTQQGAAPSRGGCQRAGNARICGTGSPEAGWPSLLAPLQREALWHG